MNNQELLLPATPADTPPVRHACEMRHGTRAIRYYLSEAVEKNRPILVIFHGHGFAAAPSQFKSPNWNVLCPMDNFGEQQLGSWYLGEDGDFFWVDAMRMLIAEVRARVGTGRLYFWGSSMGGYAALLHGALNGATAVYANTPQTWLLGSTYSNNGMRKYFEPIFGSNLNAEYNDLKTFFKSRSRTQYFLCFNQLEPGAYFAEQGLPFIGHLHSFRQRFYLEVRPLEQHGKNHGVGETIELFKRYAVQ